MKTADTRNIPDTVGEKVASSEFNLQVVAKLVAGKRTN